MEAGPLTEVKAKGGEEVRRREQGGRSLRGDWQLAGPLRRRRST